MFVSGASWREDELLVVLMEFDLRGFNASWKYAGYLCLGPLAEAIPEYQNC